MTRSFSRRALLATAAIGSAVVPVLYASSAHA